MYYGFFCSRTLAPAASAPLPRKKSSISGVHLSKSAGMAEKSCVSSSVTIEAAAGAAPAGRSLTVSLAMSRISVGFHAGAVAGLANAVTTAVVGTLLMFAYAAAKPKKGSLKKEK